MSWIVLTIAIVVAFFLCALGLCEWLVRRRQSENDGDPSAG